MNSTKGNYWTEEDVGAYLARFNRGKTKAQADPAVSATDPQPAKRARAKGSDEGQEVHPRFRVYVHSKRRRLTDPDGVSIKAAIDGLVRGQILGDDSPDWIPETPTQSQENAKVDETVIEVWELEDLRASAYAVEQTGDECPRLIVK